MYLEMQSDEVHKWGVELRVEQPHSQFDCFSKFETQYREHLSSDILHIL